MHLLTKDDLNKLHNASMEILNDVGIAFHEPEALEIFKNHGVKVDGKVVFIKERHVEEAIKTAPSQFQITGRDMEEGLSMARILERERFDALHVDAGSYDSWYWPHPPNYMKQGCMLDLAHPE